MNEKVYNYQNPFQRGESDFLVINISDVKNNNQFSTQGSTFDGNMINSVIKKDFIKFDEASQILVQQKRKQSAQFNILEIDHQQENNEKLTEYHSRTNQSTYKPSNMLCPIQENKKELSDLSLSLEQKKRKPTILMPSIKNETCSSFRNFNLKDGQKENQNQKQKKPQTQKHVRIVSEKIIKYFSEDNIQQSDQFEERNPESVEAAQKLFSSLGKQFEYIGDFSLIRKQMVELGLGRKLIVMQNTNEFVTVKQAINKDYCQCLIKACLNMDETGGVYQLKNCIYKRNKAKFQLISGDEKKYLKFFRLFLIRLWEINKLKLKNEHIVEFIVNIEMSTFQMKQFKKQFIKLYNELTGINCYEFGQLASKLVPKSIVTSIKDNFKRLRSPQKNPLTKKQTCENKQQKLLQLNTKVNEKYFQFLSKLSQINQPQDDASFYQQLQKEIYFHEFPIWKLWGFYHKNTYQLFINKKQHILMKNTIKNIFQYLQIYDQYTLFLLNRNKNLSKSEKNQKSIQNCQNNQSLAKSCSVVLDNKDKQKPQKINKDQSQSIDLQNFPYKQCVKFVQIMANEIMMPQKIYFLLFQFHQNLRSSYSQLYQNKPLIKLSSMDEELPITIFILLMTQFDKEKNITLNLIGKLEWISRWIQHKEKETPLQDDFHSQKEQELSIVKKTILTFQSAFSFIINEWDLDQCNSGQIQPRNLY